MWLFITFDAVREAGGIRYYTFQIFFISGDILPSPSGWLGRALRWVDRLLPDISLLEYLPHMFLSGQEFDKAYPQTGDYTLPEDIYLLGAEVFGGFGSEAADLYIFGGASATYTQYPPNEQGLTFLPDFEYPPPANYFEQELPYGSSWFQPPETPGRGVFNVAARANGSQSPRPRVTSYNSNLLWVYSGYDYSPGHLISHLSEFSPSGSPGDFLGVSMTRSDDVATPSESIFIVPQGPPPEGILTEWVRDSGYGDELNLIVWRYPSSPIYIPGEDEPTGIDGNVISPFLSLLSVLGAGGILPGTLGTMGDAFFKRFRVSARRKVDFRMDGEPFQMDDKPFKVQL